MERIDEIGFGGYRLIQNPDYFCYGVDAVLLASSAGEKLKEGMRVCDLGTGNGIIPLIFESKCKVKISALELQDDVADLAQRNFKLNGLEDMIELVRGNVTDYTAPEAFDLIVSNPPYFQEGANIISDGDIKRVARHEICGTLEDFMACAARNLKDNGRFYMIHRPARIIDIAQLGRKYKLEPKALRMISPSAGEVPNLMIVEFVKNGGRELKILEPKYVYENKKENIYSDYINEIYLRR
ncbi:MAG: methyltransferase [Clostridia bacterium]|nr:methyltransferase [Clostridia bacterium]